MLLGNINDKPWRFTTFL